MDNGIYFDNLQAGIVQGNIAEENHYYAYGLKIATLSSKKLGDNYEGTLKNNYLYNGKELFDDADLGWYDYGFRNYDPQIGRFTQLDPLTDDYPLLTPYQYASCDPITNIDVDGLEGCPSVGGMTGYIGKVGSSLGRGAGILQEVSKVGPLINTLNAGLNIANTSTQRNIVKQQIASDVVNNRFTSYNVSESTKPNSQKPVESLPRIQNEFRPAISTPAEKARAERNAAIRAANGGYDDSYFLEKIKRENIEAVESSPTAPIPILGNLNKAGRYGFKYGYSEEALGALKDVAIEVALIYVGGKAIGAIKYFGPAAKGGLKAIEAGEFTITKTVAKNLATRPYINSPSTITNIMKSSKGVPDAFFKGGMNYKMPGTFNGANGIFELGINPETNTIYHFLFKTVK